MWKCSFCGKRKDQVVKLMVKARTDYAVCNECARVVIDTVEDERTSPRRPLEQGPESSPGAALEKQAPLGRQGGQTTASIGRCFHRPQA